MPALHRAARGSEQSKIWPLGRNKTRMRNPHIFEADKCIVFKEPLRAEFFLVLQTRDLEVVCQFFLALGFFLGAIFFF